MSQLSEDHSSVFSKGGGGTIFELSVQAAFIITLIVKGKLPGLPTGELIEIAFQTTRLGFHTDDVMLHVRSHQGAHKLLAQIKHNLPISAKNPLFEEVMTAFWMDFNNKAAFNPTHDRLLIIKSALTQADRQDTLILLNWAKAKATANDFYQEVNRIDSKKKMLAIFFDVLQKANGGIAINAELLWEFLRCLVVLEYDFGQESSQSKANYLSLIELSRNKAKSTLAIEIWDSVFAYVAELNKNGGAVTPDSINGQHFMSYFDLSRIGHCYEAIEKLQDDGQAVLGPLTDTIVGLHLPRPEVRDRLTASIIHQPLTIVTGEPGAGKSALIKAVIFEMIPNTTVLTFKADQFNQSQLAQVFAGLGVVNNLRNLSACLAAIPKKVVFIDSLEKLLEGEPNNAFRQLMHFLDGVKDVSIVASSRTYAVELICQKYALPTVSVIEVPLLNEGKESELEKVLEAFPKLEALAVNQQIRKVIRSPKYLDFAVRWLDTSPVSVGELTITKFKDQLWGHIVENQTVIRNGMPTKRSRAFMEIALLRAQRMTLYAEPDQADVIAIDELVHDNVLTKEKSERKYAPSHDILEDWALIKHIRQLRDDSSEPVAFFQNVGNKPAFRRAFRLWVEDSLLSRAEIIFHLIRETRTQTSIEPYWADEILVALLRSDQSHLFFKEFEKELLENKAQLFQRTIHLLRTACRENQRVMGFATLSPVGSGWTSVLDFIQHHLNQLNSLRILITGLLSDWSYCLYGDHNHVPINAVEYAKVILFNYFNEIETNTEKVWHEAPLKDKIKGLIIIAFRLTGYAQTEIKALLERTISQAVDYYYYHDRSFYGYVCKMALSGVYCRPLTALLPEQVIAIAKAVWIKQPRPTRNSRPSDSDFFGQFFVEDEDDDYLNRNEKFGFRNDIHDSPSGIYKTPIYNLLQDNTYSGFYFVLELINNATNRFVTSTNSSKSDLKEVELKLLDGQLVKQWGSSVLWQAYRGTVVSSDILESLLMSLEAYLLKIAELKTADSRKRIKIYFDLLIRNSNSAAISSVLVSIAIAYPHEVGVSMLPLLGVRAFYEWDTQRAFAEMQALAPWDHEIYFAQKTRHDSNELPHRKKYSNGLKSFVLEIQLLHSDLTEAVHEVIDQLWIQFDDNDIYWQKTLHEIDSRKWKITDENLELNRFTIQPEYTPEVQNLVDKFRPEREYNEQAASISLRIDKVLKYELSIDYSEWQAVHERYKVIKNFHYIHDRPISLAVIGLRDLNHLLTSKQRTWCDRTVSKAIRNLIQDANDGSMSLKTHFSLSHFDRDAALTALPLLIKTTNNFKSRNKIIELLYIATVSNFNKLEVEPLFDSLREELWAVDASIANQVWWGIVRFAQIKKTKNKIKVQDNNRSVGQVETHVLASTLWSLHIQPIDIHLIKLNTFHSRLLTRALLLIPFNTHDEDHLVYIKHMIFLIFEELSQGIKSKNRNVDHLSFLDEDRREIEKYISKFFIYCDDNYAADIVEFLLISKVNILSKFPTYKDNKFEFLNWILRTTILELDQIVYGQFEHIGTRAIVNFWRVWERFCQVLNKLKCPISSSYLFLEFEWKEEAVHWKPLEGHKLFIKQVVDLFGKYNISPFLKLLSSVGDQTLLPEGTQWLVSCLKTDESNLIYLASDEAEALIKRLYHRHIAIIKSDVFLLNDFIWLLDQMIDLGSSHAYITRENLITYKTY
ncbi:hypothetical protein FAES_4005 [Fibrella aestuarina BUZ 2]|uniref:AAA+ ATPase domain-containing protein n=1 Tax=Fibrella aestuarina BUZ 2 TaxID=1166018 RepID=I0KD03_9BACT|nr:ATP-binding protein [Fibrella aestuarina]CCH02006.1 hypothetical protein FAES_4005 [Fibrella aestuarina BUZ 2]